MSIVEFIKENPGCKLKVDNESWSITPETPDEFELWSGFDQEKWFDNNYHSPSCFGLDSVCPLLLLVELAEAFGAEVELV